jgi:hypothetical protein
VAVVPQRAMFAVNGEEDFVRVLLVPGSEAPPAELVSINLPEFPTLGRICQLRRTRYLTEHYAPRRPDQRTMGAASPAAPPAKTTDGTTGRRPSPHPQRDVMDSPHRRPWRKAGVFQHLFDTLKPQADATGQLDWDVHCIDSTMIRAHQHAVGAKKGTPRPKRSAAVKGASARRSTSAPRERASS